LPLKPPEPCAALPGTSTAAASAMMPCRRLCGVALLLSSTAASVTATPVAKSQPLHQLDDLKSLVVRELEKWANAETAEQTSHPCERNDSCSWVLGKVSKAQITGAATMSDSPAREAHAGSSGLGPTEMHGAEFNTGSLAVGELQAVQLDLTIQRWRAGSAAQPWQRPRAAEPVEQPALGSHLRQLQPVSVSFKDDLGGRTLLMPVARPSRPQMPLVTSLASLQSGLA